MGPLTGVRVVEIAGIGPGPFCAMMLADAGADVVRVDRASRVWGGDPGSPPADVLGRGRRSIGVDLKSPDGVETVLRLAEGADALLEGFRPGVAERLGIGPEDCLARNPELVYGRMTGWGQDGPYAQAAGHDLNYISLAGVLGAIGRRGQAPVPPLNLVGDFGGGGMYLAFGIVCALLEARSGGRGQVVDAAMVDGAASLMSFVYGMRAMGYWTDERGANMLDTGAPYYDVYETSDGRYLSVAAIEPQFYAEMRERLGLDGPQWDEQNRRDRWPELKAELVRVVASKTLDEWCEILEGSDACWAPVLSPADAPDHPHNRARGAFTESFGVLQPRPAPRFSRTDSSIQRPPPHPGQHTDEILGEIGLDAAAVAALRSSGAVA